MIALTIAYLTSLAAVLLLSFILPGNESALAEIKRANWAMFAVGLGAAAIEVGFLFAYRTGWNISSANLFVNIAIALIVIPIGLAFFKEHLTAWKLAGIGFCIVGLILLSKR